MAGKRARDGMPAFQEGGANDSFFSRCDEVKSMRAQLIYAHGGTPPGDHFRVYIYDPSIKHIDSIAVPRQGSTVATLVEGMEFSPREQLIFRGRVLAPRSTLLDAFGVGPESIVTVVRLSDSTDHNLLELDAELAHLQALISQSVAKLESSTTYPPPISVQPFPPGHIPSIQSSLADSNCASTTEQAPVRRVVVRGAIGRQTTVSGTITNDFSGSGGVVTTTINPDGTTSVQRHGRTVVAQQVAAPGTTIVNRF